MTDRLIDAAPEWDGDMLLACRGCTYQGSTCSMSECTHAIEAFSKLSAYENTDLSPDDVAILKDQLQYSKDAFDTIMDECRRAQARIAELERENARLDRDAQLQLEAAQDMQRERNAAVDFINGGFARDCDNCKYCLVDDREEPCKSCSSIDNGNYEWREPKEDANVST